MPYVELLSGDGEICIVEEEAAKQSTLILNFLEEIEGTDKDKFFSLPKIRSTVLRKVIEWVEHHNNSLQSNDTINDSSNEENESNMGSDESTDLISDWDKSFMEVDRTMLFELINAATYLEIEGLLHLTCWVITRAILAKSVEELREYFNVKPDFPGRSLQEIMFENQFVVEKD